MTRAKSKRGAPPGPDHPRALFTWEEVRQLRADRAILSELELAKALGCHRSTIGKLTRGETYRVNKSPTRSK